VRPAKNQFLAAHILWVPEESWHDTGAPLVLPAVATGTKTGEPGSAGYRPRRPRPHAASARVCRRLQHAAAAAGHILALHDCVVISRLQRVSLYATQRILLLTINWSFTSTSWSFAYSEVCRTCDAASRAADRVSDPSCGLHGLHEYFVVLRALRGSSLPATQQVVLLIWPILHAHCMVFTKTSWSFARCEVCRCLRRSRWMVLLI